jgi:hypothetical protein
LHFAWHIGLLQSQTNHWQDNDLSSNEGAFRVTLSRLRASLGSAASIERDFQACCGLVGARLDVHEFLKALSGRELEQMPCVIKSGGTLVQTN